MICSECKNDYPSEFIDLMTYQRGYISPCPECALKLVNEIHGTDRKDFAEGSVAQQLLENFRKYKNKKADQEMVEKVMAKFPKLRKIVEKYYEAKPIETLIFLKYMYSELEERRKHDA